MGATVWRVYEIIPHCGLSDSQSETQLPRESQVAAARSAARDSSSPFGITCIQLVQCCTELFTVRTVFRLEWPQANQIFVGHSHCDSVAARRSRSRPSSESSLLLNANTLGNSTVTSVHDWNGK